MNFSVFWKPAAIESLAGIYESFRRQGDNTRIITRAAIRIDLLLEREPSTQGESRGKGRRVLIESPLTAYIESTKPRES